MFARTLRELRRYPSAIFGLSIVALLVALSIYTVIAIPYKEAIQLWRGGDNTWYRQPKIAAPAWTNWFLQKKLPETIVLSTIDDPSTKTVTQKSDSQQVDINFSFNYQADAFPQDITFYFDPVYVEAQPFVSVTLLTPDGRELRLYDGMVQDGQVFYVAQDKKLQRRYGDFPQNTVLSVPDSSTGSEQRLEPATPLKGVYQVHISAIVFEPDSTLDAECIIYGQVHGIAGTDDLRRDLTIALLWGIPIALIFGLLAAIGTTFTTMFIAAAGTWFGGWLDELIQRITGVNLVLPFLPILIMVGTFYSRSIWAVLGITILLNIFGGGIMAFRANFLQVRESPYIEAARAYGAKSGRIIVSYMVPRLIPLIIPQLVNLIPGYVFLEATLAVLGLGDPVLPTWGKVIQNAYNNGALYLGYYYWILEPSILLMITGLAFAMLGFSLDRIFNPRLRSQ
jgi:peptide/nickel transport system permease protein